MGLCKCGNFVDDLSKDHGICSKCGEVNINTDFDKPVKRISDLENILETIEGVCPNLDCSSITTFKYKNVVLIASSEVIRVDPMYSCNVCNKSYSREIIKKYSEIYKKSL